MSVPKFGSFKPKPKPLPSLDSEHRQDRRSNTPHRHASREPANSDTPQWSSQHQSSRLRSKAPLGDKTAESSRHRISHEREHEPDLASESDLFIVDRRGDAKNVEFGSLHRYSVPKYHRSGHTRVIGLTRNVHLTGGTSASEGATLETKNLLKRKREERPLRRKAPPYAPVDLQILPKADSGSSDLAEDYTPLADDSSQETQLPADGYNKPQPTDYRSLGVDARSDAIRSAGSREDCASHRSSNHPVNVNGDRVRQHHGQLLRATKLEPESAETWKALIDFQQKVLDADSSDHSPFDQRQRRALAEIKISIYRKALKSVRATDAHYPSLMIGLLEEEALVTEASSLAEHWQRALEANPQADGLWMAYLDFVQSNHVGFTYAHCADVFHACLTRFSRVLKEDGGRDVDYLESKLVAVFTRFTKLMQDAGYEELSMAVWQTALECTFFHPSGDSSFEDFWDGDVPRLGEPNAIGWCNAQQQTRGDAAGEGGDGDSKPETRLDLSIKEVFKEELRLCRQLHLPATANDENVGLDPYRDVMFSDISWVPDAIASLKNRTNLIDAFLQCLGLPPTLSYRQADAQFNPPASSNRYLGDLGMIGFEVETTSLFDDAFGPFEISTRSRDGREQQMSEFIDRVLLQLSTSEYFDESIAEYHLAFRSHTQPGQVATLARKYLKARPSSLRLYNAYALAEWKMQNVAKAREVWVMASTTCDRLSEAEKQNEIMLVRDRTIREAESGHDDTALAWLLSTGSQNGSHVANQEATAISKLKAEQKYVNGWVETVDQRKYDLAVLHAESHAWLEYLTSEHDLTKALAYHEKWATTLISRAAMAAAEKLQQAKIRLIQIHVKHKRPYKPSLLRAETAKTLALFPNNRVFLAAHARYDQRLQLEDRVRASLRDEISNDPSAGVIRWSFVLDQELQRYRDRAPGYTQHSVRSMFTKALLSIDSRVSHATALWNRWYDFEMAVFKDETEAAEHGSARRSGQKLVQVVLNAFRYLPWYRFWVIRGASELLESGAMDEATARSLRESLIDRGLRLRVEMEGLG